MLFDFLKKNKKEPQSTVEPEYPSVLPKITLVQGKEEIPELQGDYRIAKRVPLPRSSF